MTLCCLSNLSILDSDPEAHFIWSGRGRGSGGGGFQCCCCGNCEGPGDIACAAYGAGLMVLGVCVQKPDGVVIVYVCVCSEA